MVLNPRPAWERIYVEAQEIKGLDADAQAIRTARPPRRSADAKIWLGLVVIDLVERIPAEN